MELLKKLLTSYEKKFGKTYRNDKLEMLLDNCLGKYHDACLCFIPWKEFESAREALLIYIQKNYP